ncbi:Transcriptional regulator LytR [Streptomyces sp. RB5]|uniref:Transcriptional regulator LytR n=1 Tax=Streptomyces smaragdinus TaxID=2585196 RepID=A0A7K0CF69_9ACTN|nr:LCP family protein [Streptomyces smaragdinus]MQY12003.1 Transcriptional regulator LytR [Streptomyces smaragdinus]
MPDNSRPIPEPGTPRGSRRGRHRSPRRTGLRIAAWTLAGAVAAGGALAGVAYLRLNGNLTSVDLDARLGTERPQNVDNGSLDILVLGSDSRAGANAAYGRDTGARSDTAMVVHLYDHRKKASIVSIPRDTLVDRPSCVQDNGATAPAAHDVMFNSAYTTGGPACSVKTVEHLTGIRMDHFVEIDFTGFKHLVDKLGGVKLTTTEPINDTSSHLNLPAGTHTLTGEQSLALVRTRKSVGDGSDLGRIKLQQTFLTALLTQVKHMGLLTSPTKLYGLADTATSSITTDKDLSSITALTSLAKSTSSLNSSTMQLITLPVTYDTQDPNRVRPLEPQSTQVWKALKSDRRIPPTALQNSAAEAENANGTISSP